MVGAIRVVHEGLGRLVLLTVLAALSPGRAALAQYCIGHTAYIVRDETGAVMTTEQLERFTVRINGVPTRVRTDTTLHQRVLEYELRSPGVDSSLAARATPLANPLAFGIDGIRTACGQLGDLTIANGSKVMHLLFDIREHNTHFEIDGLPFREGTFHLGSLRCHDGARPPAVDNTTSAKCFVTADNWQATDKDWVRYVIPRPMRASEGTASVPPEECRTKTLDAITERATSDSLRATYPSLNQWFAQGVDFRVQFLLAVYQTNGGSYSLKSFRVDKQGNLTFEPPPGPAAHVGNCTAMYVALFRSGIRSIDGTPMPPASTSP